MNTLINFLSRCFVLVLLFVGCSVLAQVGNDNPTGVAGYFNGNVTTGCSYDPYTANSSRSVTDLTVAGGVGTYPLAFTRTFNSRAFSGWQHSYLWSIPDSDVDYPTGADQPGYVYFPDGRVVIFSYSASDIYYRGPAGVRERFQPFDATTNLGYLILPDGGKVEFKRTRYDITNTDYTPPKKQHYFTFRAQALIDPFGQRTNFTYNPDGTLQKITEPAGRWIQLTYSTVTFQKVITQVAGSDGRSVQYSYATSLGYTVLDHVVYFGDASLTARYRYCAPYGVGYSPLLWTCDDPMYPGPMRRIAYIYATTNNDDGTAPVYGQILSENYYDGTNVGAAVSTLSVYANTRTEHRGDGPYRTFSYTGYKLTSTTDFKGVSASQGYDSNSFVNSTTDRNGNTTNFTNNALSGVVTQTQYPLTPGDTPSGTPRGTVTYTYGSASCPDPNNRDANNPYYLYSTTDEGGHSTIYTRDENKRITRIDYPDGGVETFGYYPNPFGQVLTHVLKTGGTETFTYDGSGIKLTYRNPSNASGNPTARYTYDAKNRISIVTDVFGNDAADVNHSVGYTYNARGQLTVTTFPTDPIDGQRHTIQNTYNPNGDSTLISVTDQLGHVTSYTYDDYRRRRSMTTPLRSAGDPTPRTTNSSYDTYGGTGDDYTHTDANVRLVTLPSGNKIRTSYDENYRKQYVTVCAADGADTASTSYLYDSVGNLIMTLSPNQQYDETSPGTSYTYDERNRQMSMIDALGKQTSFSYDAGGHKAKIIRANGQVTTFNSYDAMNRLLQQTVQQAPDPDAVTKYTYYTSGLLHTMQDPRLVATPPSSYNYNYVYDTMGRKTSLAYPPDSIGVQRTESWHYDVAGRTDTFTNRAGNIQTIAYDALNRPTSVTWNDGGITPTVTLGYDVAARLTAINNANATISRIYFNDNLLNSETETPSGQPARTVTCGYNADGKRATIQYPAGAYSFTYNYTGRDQLKTLVNNAGGATVITYGYDSDGNLTTRTPANTTNSSYTYDTLDHVTHITHALNGTSRAFDYAYDSVGNRKWTKRDGGNGDVFGYDSNDQVTATKLNVPNPDTTAVGNPTIVYDANGNRTQFAAYGTTDNYTINNLNQYITRNAVSLNYDPKGNLMTFGATQSYQFDAQNRLTSATNGGNTLTFKYDGLNRQVSRTLNNGTPIYSVWDGWDLIEDVQNGTVIAAYLSGAGGLVKNLVTGNYYYQDASGSTSHLANNTGQLLEWYRYDLQGAPVFYNSINQQLSTSNYSVRHLFIGQQWYRELGLYDLRNRFYSPDIGRFLQADPISFDGDPSNLYRYCHNNPLKSADPTGLQDFIPYNPMVTIPPPGYPYWGPDNMPSAVTMSDTFAAVSAITGTISITKPGPYSFELGATSLVTGGLSWTFGKLENLVIFNQAQWDTGMWGYDSDGNWINWGGGGGSGGSVQLLYITTDGGDSISTVVVSGDIPRDNPGAGPPIFSELGYGQWGQQINGVSWDENQPLMRKIPYHRSPNGAGFIGAGFMNFGGEWGFYTANIVFGDGARIGGTCQMSIPPWGVRIR